MKKILALLLTLVMVLSLAACGSSDTAADSKKEESIAAEETKEEATEEAAEEESTEEETAADAPAAANDPAVTLVYAEVNPLDSIIGQTAAYFAEQVSELSGGSVTIDIQASGVLGSEMDVLDSILGGAGTIDMARISAFTLTGYGAQKPVLLSLPFTFQSREHFWNFANSDLAAEFLNEPQTLGLPIRGVFYGEEGFRHFFTVDPIESIDDLAGMKLRVSNDPVMNSLVESLGASHAVVPFTELYSALQNGDCDGAEQLIANYKSNAFQEVAPYLILDGHTLNVVQTVISDNAWNKLTEAQQEAIMEAGKLAQAFNQQLSQSTEDEALAELIEEGVTVIDNVDKAALAEKCSDVINANIAGQEELYQQIVDMQ